MTIDFDKIRRKRQEEKARKTRIFDKIRFYKPAKGENLIRLMPPWTTEGENANQFWREIYQHWNVGAGGYDEEGGWRYTCPVKTPDGPGGTCEVCDLSKELREKGTPAELELAKNLSARRAVLSNIVALKDPVFTQDDLDKWKEGRADSDEPSFRVGDTKVQVYSYGSDIFNDIMACFDDENINIADLDSGHDLVVDKEVLDPTNPKFTKYRTRMKTKPTAFKFVGDITKLLYNLDNVSPFPEAGAMRKALNGESASTPELPAKSVPSLPTSVGVEDDSMDAVKRLEAEMRAALNQ